MPCEFILGTKPPAEVFQQAISLGGGCHPSWHLQRKFGGLVRSPFDWMLTPYFSMLGVLEDDGRYLGTSFFAHKRGITCAHYGVIYYHEFPRVEGDIFMVNSSVVTACRSKMTHKMSKLIEACKDNYRTLFIRVGSYDEVRGVTITALNELVCLLSRKFPNLDFQVVYIGEASADAEPLSRISFVKMGKLANLPSPGSQESESDQQWDEFFSAFKFDISSPHLKLDTDGRH